LKEKNVKAKSSLVTILSLWTECESHCYFDSEIFNSFTAILTNPELSRDIAEKVITGIQNLFKYEDMINNNLSFVLSNVQSFMSIHWDKMKSAISQKGMQGKVAEIEK
jgi:hypothetical protein